MGFNSAFKGLKDSNRAPVARLGPEINSRACLCVLQGPRHNARCWFFIQPFIFFLILCLSDINPLNAELNPICHLLALLGGATIVVVSRLRVNNSWIFSTEFLKHWSVKFNENMSSVSRVVPCGRTDGRTDTHGEYNNRLSQFCERN